MQKNEENGSPSAQRVEMTFVELIALFVRKRRLFILLFVVVAALFAGGSVLRAMLFQRAKGDEFIVIAKAIVVDPYFDHAGEFCSGLAVTEAAAALVAKDMGVDASTINRKNVAAAYDSLTKTLSITVKGQSEEEARRRALANMEATRGLMRLYGGERYDRITDSMESAADAMLSVSDGVNSKDAASYFEGYAQAVATRVEIASLVGADREHDINSAYPYNLLARDLEAAKAAEMTARGRLETYVKEAGIPMTKAVAEAENRSAEILRSKIALLREALPVVPVVFDVVDVKVERNPSAGVGMKVTIGFIAALFLAIVAVLVSGYADRVKADPKAMLLLRESRAHPSRRGKP